MTASSHKSLEFEEVAANARRLFGSRGGASRQDVLTAETADGPLENKKGQEACTSNKKAEKQGVGRKGKMLSEKWRGSGARSRAHIE